MQPGQPNTRVAVYAFLPVHTAPPYPNIKSKHRSTENRGKETTPQSAFSRSQDHANNESSIDLKVSNVVEVPEANEKTENNLNENVSKVDKKQEEVTKIVPALLLNKASMITLNTVNVLLTICCIVLSITMAISRFKTNTAKSLIDRLYLLNGLADFLVGAGYLLQCPVMYLMILKGRGLASVTIPVFTSYFVTSIAVKMSVFMNCVMGTVRCINILRPFYRVNRKALAVSTALYMMVWSVIVALDILWFTGNAGTKNQIFLVKSLVMKGQPGFGVVLMTTYNKERGPSYLGYHLANFVQFIFPTVLPSCLCFVLMVAQLRTLLKKPVISPAEEVKEKMKVKEKVKEKVKDTKGSSKSRASLTILLLTSIYVGTSAVSILTWLIVDGRKGYLGSKSKYEEHDKERAASWIELTATYFSLSTCSLICSTLTPLTLLLRGSGTAISSVKRIFSRRGFSSQENSSQPSRQV